MFAVWFAVVAIDRRWEVSLCSFTFFQLLKMVDQMATQTQDGLPVSSLALVPLVQGLQF
jgi:hypothetical protein